ncbi:MAG TPA: metallophosphoesterase family protein [Gaiellaceae bacterium]|nr:metallophosphoesterase family protein [Gaiellaceae bacterium]
MRVAALYDVHGNLPALEAVLAEVEREGPDIVVCGGDALWGPFPRATLECLLELGDRVRFLRGNTERETAAAERHADEWLDAVTRHTAADLGPERLELVAAWPERLTVDVDGLGAVLFCHATPRSDRELVTRLTPDERLADSLADVEERVVVAGHTHTQLDRVVGRTRFVNAGSVGMPYEREPGAYWALLGANVELRRTAYDLDDAARRIRASALPAADTFVRENVLANPAPDETARIFEAQAANSEK